MSCDETDPLIEGNRLLKFRGRWFQEIKNLEVGEGSLIIQNSEVDIQFFFSNRYLSIGFSNGIALKIFIT